MPPPPPPLAVSSRSKSTSAHPPSEPEIPSPSPPPALSSCRHPSYQTETSSPPPASNLLGKLKSAHPSSWLRKLVALNSGSQEKPSPQPPPALGNSDSARPSSQLEIPLHPPPPDVGHRAESESDAAQPAGDPKIENPSVRTISKSALNGRNREEFTSTVRGVLPDNFRFRILVVGKSDSGKSSLINSIFKVETAPTSANADINVGFPHPDNGRLIVHECPGFEPGSAQNFPSIREFITRRTKADLSQLERLHTIWVCVPTLDLIDGTLGDGVEEILSMQKVPVVLVFTKFDLLVSKVLFDIAGGDSQQHERAKVEAERKYAESCHLLLRKQPRDVPAEIVSTNPGLSDLISKLFATTHRLVVADSVNATVVSTSFEAQGEKIQNPPVSLAWSIAQRVSREVNLRASIVVGQSRYWRSLGSSDEFSGRTLEECTEVIHSDIVDVWNLLDHRKYLSSGEFKAQMSHLVKDLAEPLAGAPPSSNLDDIIEARSATPAAQWVKNPYQNTTENIGCTIGYIVDLTVIHNELFRSGRDVSVGDVLSVMDRHDKSGTWSRIHNEIRRIVTETAQMSYGLDNLILEKAIRLITQFCDPLSGSS
ncbi:hypothetical protein BJV78DRAFT_197290 [Lactifluus subvellereus]|nr:hypothetical protein BJV78DRAFT_197290 [Lactifluus subvellereus]